MKLDSFSQRLVNNLYCQELDNEFYRDELYEMARAYHLPVTSKSTKAELCQILSQTHAATNARIQQIFQG